MANEITQKGGSVNSKPGHWERSSLRNKNFLKKGKKKKKRKHEKSQADQHIIRKVPKDGRIKGVSESSGKEILAKNSKNRGKISIHIQQDQ